MHLRFLVVVAVLLLGCLVAARPRTTKQNNQDLDGIGSDLEDFIRHKESSQSFQGFNRRVNVGDVSRSPSNSSGKSKSTLDRISDFFRKVLSNK